jgi:carbon catabolite-derepressing protein kinase
MKAIIAGPITAIMVYRAIKKKSLTPLATVAAILTAIAHAYHPWNMPLVLLMVFFFTGTRVTHVGFFRFELAKQITL